MRVGVQTWGSEGDVRPFLALALGLSEAGHDVTAVVTSMEERDYAPMLEGSGVGLVQTAGLGASEEELAELGRISMRGSPIRQFSFVTERLLRPSTEAMWEASLELCRKSDMVVGHLFAWTLPVAAELTGTPRAAVLTTPAVLPSRHIPLVGLPPLGPLLTGLIWRLAAPFFNRMVAPVVNGLRERAGLPKARWILEEVLIGDAPLMLEVSPSLLERPPDWPDYILTGRFRHPAVEGALPMPPELDSFLEDGKPPVYFTAGSMMAFDPDVPALLGTLAEASRRVGCRLAVQCDRSEARDFRGDGIIVVARAPHEGVFPRCAAVVHHCGAGTTHTAAACGVPSVPLMYGVDQLFWGPHLHRIGLSSRPLGRSGLRPRPLARAMEDALTSVEMRERAGAVAVSMAEEDGVAEAIRHLGL